MGGRLRFLSALGVAVLMAVSVLGFSGCAAITGRSASDPGATPWQDDSQTKRAPDTQDLAAAPPGATAPGEGMAVEGERASVADSGATADRLVIRTKSMSLEVKDARKAADAVGKLAARFGGYITDASISSDTSPRYLPEEEIAPGGGGVSGGSGGQDGPFTAVITLKVPAGKFEALIAECRKLGDVESENESQQDVTQRHVDLKARLKNLEAEERRLVQFFDAAKTVKDMLSIERELSRVRGEIESHKATIDHLESSAAMGTLTLTMHEPRPVVSPAGPGGWGVVRSVTQAIRNFVNVVNLIIMFTGALLPIVLLTLAGFLLIRWLVRRRSGDSTSGGSADRSSANDAASGGGSADGGSTSKD